MVFFNCYPLQEFLRNPDKYIRLGARPPRGVLLVSFKFDIVVGLVGGNQSDIL